MEPGDLRRSEGGIDRGADVIRVQIVCLDTILVASIPAGRLP